MVLGIPKRTLFIAAAVIGVALIYIIGSEGRPTGGPQSAGCELVVNADVLNIRSAPSATSQIVGKYQQNSTIGGLPTVQNGFRKLAEGGWAAEKYLVPVDRAMC